MQERLLIFKPAIVSRRESLSLTEAKRKHPVVLTSNAYSETLTLKLPAGFAVDELPDAVKLDTTFGSYATNYEVKDGHLLFTRKLVQKAGTIPVEQYAAVRISSRRFAPPNNRRWFWRSSNPRRGYSAPATIASACSFSFSEERQTASISATREFTTSCSPTLIRKRSPPTVPRIAMGEPASFAIASISLRADSAKLMMMREGDSLKKASLSLECGVCSRIEHRRSLTPD